MEHFLVTIFLQIVTNYYSDKFPLIVKCSSKYVILGFAVYSQIICLILVGCKRMCRCYWFPWLNMIAYSSSFHFPSFSICDGVKLRRPSLFLFFFNSLGFPWILGMRFLFWFVCWGLTYLWICLGVIFFTLFLHLFSIYMLSIFLANYSIRFFFFFYGIFFELEKLVYDVM